MFSLEASGRPARGFFSIFSHFSKDVLCHMKLAVSDTGTGTIGFEKI